MSLVLDSFAIGPVTRRFLGDLVLRGVLDAPSAALLERAVARHRPKGPGGIVLRLATALGASEADAYDAGSLAETYGAMCNLTDDLEDGDAEAWLADVPAPVRINLGAQLIAVAVARAAPIYARVCPERAADELGRAFETGAAMLTGQRVELLREDWSIAAWRRVAELVAGRQVEFYLRLAALAARRDPGSLEALGLPIGVLTQLNLDRIARDSRLEGLAADGLAALEAEARAELARGLDAVPSEAIPVLRLLVLGGCGAEAWPRGR